MAKYLAMYIRISLEVYIMEVLKRCGNNVFFY